MAAPNTIKIDEVEYVRADAQKADAALIARAVNSHAELLAALEEFEIEECPRCGGDGKEPGTKGHDACHRCAGAGEILRGGWPAHVRAAIAKAKSYDP